mmetsp:Transcript_2776/g.4299  ORF Transcript_2776/g.4299 Transcript_2776/m.4299 type:complete len:236 (-) Transcript_2776:117-824(-)
MCCHSYRCYCCCHGASSPMTRPRPPHRLQPEGNGIRSRAVVICSTSSSHQISRYLLLFFTATHQILFLVLIAFNFSNRSTASVIPADCPVTPPPEPTPPALPVTTEDVPSTATISFDLYIVFGLLLFLALFNSCSNFSMLTKTLRPPAMSGAASSSPFPDLAPPFFFSAPPFFFSESSESALFVWEEREVTLSILPFFLPMTVLPSTTTSKTGSAPGEASDPRGESIRFSRRTSG